VAADGLTPPFRFGVAHRAFQWLLPVIEKPSFRLVELPPPGAKSVLRLEFVELGSSMALACCAAALSPPLHSGLLWLCVPDDLSVYLSSTSADTSARQVWQVLLEDLLEQDEALTILVELGLELS